MDTTTKTLHLSFTTKKCDSSQLPIEADTKKVISLSCKSKTMIEKEPPKTRKVAEKWTFEHESLSAANQFVNLEKLLNVGNNAVFASNSHLLEIHRQINYKIHSYRSQDLKKSLYDESKFVDYTYVMELLREKQLLCFYCREPTSLMYETVREGKQWTLDRIDNSFGHNRGNVEIACLTCNLRRRTMYHERYVFTKQMTRVKLLDK
jgi:hypothetical protein